MSLIFKSFHGAPIYGEVCVEQPRDLFLVVDDSASIGHTDIKKVREFLSELVASVHVSRDMTRIGFLQFSDEKNTGIRFNLDNNFDAETIRQKFLHMKYNGGVKTLTGLALQMVVEQVFTKTGGDRPDVPDVVVVLTDGQSRHPLKTVEQANRLKAMGVRIIAIGAGNDLTGNVLNSRKEKLKEELLAIASSPDDMKMVNIKELEKIVFEIVNKVCRIVTTSKPPTQPTQETRFRVPAPELPIGSLGNRLGATTSAPQGCAASIGKDILFVIDGTVNFQQSYDESQKDFRRIKKFIKTVVRDLSDERFNVGVMQYTNKRAAKMEIDFMSVKHHKEIRVRVGTIIQDGGDKRFTGDALVKANNKFYDLDALKQRWGNPNVIVLITRGNPDDPEHAISEARMLESRNVRLVTVGVYSSGASPKHLEGFLRNITFPKFMILSKYRDLRKNSQVLLDAVCEKEDHQPRPGLAMESAQCRRGPHDIFFVIDGSASIKYHNFEKVQVFLMDFISLLRVETSEINTGLLQFSQEDLTTFIWELGAYTDVETIMKIRKMKYQAGKRTATGDALTRVNKVFSGGRGDRPGVDDIVVVFTDGNAHDIKVAREQADILKSKGVLVMTIGAGKKSEVKLFEKELSDMASSPEYAMTVDFDQLEYFAEKAFPLVCKYMRLKKL